MTDKETFEEIKREILRRAHVARACKEQYRRECYDVLYEHSTGSMRRTIETK